MIRLGEVTCPQTFQTLMSAQVRGIAVAVAVVGVLIFPSAFLVEQVLGKHSLVVRAGVLLAALTACGVLVAVWAGGYFGPWCRLP